MATITLKAPLEAEADSVRADQGAPGPAPWPTRVVNGMVPTPYDHFDVARDAAGNIEQITYRLGGPSGDVVATLVIGRDGAGRVVSGSRV